MPRRRWRRFYGAPRECALVGADPCLCCLRPPAEACAHHHDLADAACGARSLLGPCLFDGASEHHELGVFVRATAGGEAAAAAAGRYRWLCACCVHALVQTAREQSRLYSWPTIELFVDHLRVYRLQVERDEAAHTCCVCMHEYTSGRMHLIAPCGHHFCFSRECEAAIVAHGRCPLCRIREFQTFAVCVRQLLE